MATSPTQQMILEHYASQSNFRTDLMPPIERFISTFVRFVSKIEIDLETGCWNWVGARDKHGYGRWGTPARKTVFTHRLAYEIMVGDIPEGLGLDHLCRNTSCCNPDHLEPVTQAENVRRGNRWPG